MSETGSARARLEANAVDYEALKTFVFSARCTNCHNPTNRRGGVDLSEYEVITSSGGLVIPGNPTASLLYRTVAGGSMPEGGPPLEEFEVRAIFDWIQKGAPRDSAGVPPVVVEPPVTIEPTYDSIYEHIFASKCKRCHSSDNESGPEDFVDVTNYDDLIANPFHPDLIVAGDSARSKILESLRPGPNGERPRMPKNDLPLSDIEFEIIRAWIGAGAPKSSN